MKWVKQDTVKPLKYEHQRGRTECDHYEGACNRCRDYVKSGTVNQRAVIKFIFTPVTNLLLDR